MPSSWKPWIGILTLFGLLHTTINQSNMCDVSEFQCSSKNGQGSVCLSMDRWCDGREDCENRVDEPRSCSVCNRTYYGRLASTYRLSLMRPRMAGMTTWLPWRCWLNFTALGGYHGDRVLVGWESFSIGQLIRSENGTECHGGQVTQRDSSWMELEGRNSGAWCGEGWGHPFLLSTGTWLLLDIRIDEILELSRFRLDLTYRVVPKSISHSTKTLQSIFYGDQVPGTMCSRNLYSCDQKNCVIQSPHFPAMYPRNMTCYYYIRQSWSPQNESILISIGQNRSDYFSLRSSTKEDQLYNGRFCSQQSDSLSIYSGATIDTPLLDELCGTGLVPWMTSSGSEMLVVFRSSAYESPFNPSPLGVNPGFSLQVRVDFLRRFDACRMRIDSKSGSRGTLTHPPITLPWNTTCRYEFVGRSDQRIWLSFSSYSLLPLQEKDLTEDTCFSITDGDQVLEHSCGTTIHPRLCVHQMVHNSTDRRPCHHQEESYISDTSRLTVTQHLSHGTSLLKWTFSLHYEFVTLYTGSTCSDAYTDEEKLAPVFKECSTTVHNTTGTVESPRNVLLYGRGGTKNLKCVYRFQAQERERVNLTIHMFHASTCQGMECRSCLSIEEFFWPQVQRRSYRTCKTQTNPVHVLSAAPLVELTFQVENMTWQHDDDDFYFAADYTFITGLDEHCRRVRYLKGSRGILDTTRDPHCTEAGIPWFLEAPKRGRFLLQLPANLIILQARTSYEECLTYNRFYLYSVTEGRAEFYREICVCHPTDEVKSSSYLYSAGWNEMKRDDDHLLVIPSFRSHPSELDLAIEWLVVYQDSPQSTVPSIAIRKDGNVNKTISSSSMTCRTACPVFKACLSPDIWCDDRIDCPDGSDELDCIRLTYWPLYLGLAVILSVVTSAACLPILIRRHYHRRRYRVKRKYKSPKETTKFSSITVDLKSAYDKSGPGS